MAKNHYFGIQDILFSQTQALQHIFVAVVLRIVYKLQGETEKAKKYQPPVYDTHIFK